MIPFFQGFETNDTTGITVATGATISRVTSGTNSICGAINSLTGNEYAVLTPGNDAWGVCAGGALGDTAGGNNGDFINGPPYPPYVGDFTLSMSFYIPITGTGAWSAAPNQSFAAFQIWGNSNSETQQYDLELPEIYFGVPGGGSPVSIFYNTGGWAICSAPGWPIASISSNGWYTFATSYIKTGDRVNDPTAAVITVYNSAGNIVGVPFPIPGWQPNSAQIPYAGENVQNGPPLPSSDMLGSAQWGIESWQTPQDNGLMVGPSGGYPSIWQPAGICIDNIQTLVGQLNPADAPVFSNLSSGQMLNATIGTSFSLTLSASNATAYYIAGYNAGVYNSGGFDGLPAGLTLNSSTGVITGIPTGSASYCDMLVMAVNATSFSLLRVHFNIAASGTPAITAVPTISGTAQVGSVLTCNHGSYSGSPTSYGNQWFSNGVKISGATGSTYTCATGDIGNVITVSETPLNGTGSGQIAFSAASSAVIVKSGAPVNAVTPVISGNIGTVGAVLTASNGNWSGSPTGFLYTWYLNGQPITTTYSNGSTSSTYTQQSWDVLGLPITVSVQAYNASGYSVPAFSNGISSPVNTVLPTVGGTPQVGQTMVATQGTWTGATSFSYQWVWGDTGVSISGATTLSYVPVSGDIGHTLEIKVTATNSAGSTSATSLSTSSITGVTSMAKTINYQCASSGNAGLGAYTGDGQSSPVWNYSVNSPISSVLNSDGTTATGVSIAFINGGTYGMGTSPQIFSTFMYEVSATGTVTISGLSPSANYQLYIYSQNGGFNDRGTNFSITTGTGSPTGGSNASTNNNGISGSYTLNANYLIFNVTANSSGIIQFSYTANPAATGTSGNQEGDFNGFQLVTLTGSLPSNSILPIVTGTASVGSTLTGTQGTWSGATSFAYQWIWADTGANISGATSSTYVPQATDEGHTLAIKVTATNSTGSASATSVATSVIPVPVTIPVNSVLPVITGTVTVGNTLTATSGTWSQSPTYAYQWVWGDTGVSILGATSLTYVIQTTDETHTLEIKVIATNSAGSVTAVSVATSAVPVPSSLPPNGTVFNRAGLTQTFQSNFTGPTPLVTNSMTKAASDQWIIHTPWNGDFGYSPSNIANVSIVKDPLLDGESVLQLSVNGTNGGPWTGAILSTTDAAGNGFKQVGGVFECRMKLPSGQGLWPAFWLDSCAGPNPVTGVTSEIDVIEIYTEWVNGYWATIHRWLAGVDTNTNNAFQIQPPVSPCDGNYHTYTVEITPTYGVLIYMDDVQVAAFQGDASVSGPMTMLLDLVVGGAGLAASACDGFSLPSNMLVSWVRAWKRP